ncbi:NAC domain-containing protein [Heracleum sosnowskyi]|uniref:NAC domain-containing protein n=1 Tax=Heracleum sosnowskyi TaxID=360622 RepID=A0AAD8HS98_9APIA|nr:NAC domain-containing protein [Heracleum sosnowskyi]
MVKMSLPPGFRFHPTDVEAMMYYLKRKVTGKKLIFDAVTELNIYQFGPWDLPDKCLLKSKDLEWYFFCPKEKKYTSGPRANRATQYGFWKATGKDRSVTYNQRTVGLIKTLIFHRGHAPKGERTNWVMHEYRLKDEKLANVDQDAYVLCKIFQKSGLGPKNGAQYGAPFNEDEWSDIEETFLESPPVQCQTFVNNVPPSNIGYSDAVNSSVPVNSLVSYVPELDTSTEGPQNIDMQPIMKEVCVESSAVDSRILANYVPPGTIGSSPAVPIIPPGNSNMWSTSKLGPSEPGPLDMGMSDILLDPDNDILGSLDMFIDDVSMPPVGINTIEKFDRSGQLPQLDENDIYDKIGDLDDWIEVRDTGINISTNQDAVYNLTPVLIGDEAPFLELNDLSTPFSCPSETVKLDWLWTDSGYTAHTRDMSIPMDENYSGGANICSVEKVPGGNECPTLLGPHLGNNPEELWKDYCIGNFEGHGFDAVVGNEAPFSSTEPEGSSTVKQIERRGKKQPNLQLLLESLYAHMTRAEQLIDNFPHSGSSIHFKAEVTLTVGECTKDALLHNMEESACILITWDNQLIVDAKSRRPIVAIYVLLSYLVLPSSDIN